MLKAISKLSISAEMAQRMIEAAESKANVVGKDFVIAIVDESGHLKAFKRMDNAPLVSIQVAQDKAFTAIGMGISTDTWHEVIKNDPPLAAGAPPGINRLIVFGGGYPIKINEQTIGGIGVSGGHYTEDMEVAKAALEVLNEDNQ